jgi:cyclopropane fatty-acyl-phospholipid synthase-like methyltransferase
MEYKVRKDCRACHSTKLKKFLSLGNMPLPNAFLTKAQLHLNENKYPLDVMFCEVCGMVQLKQVVNAPSMFTDYAYFTGASIPIRKHFDEMADSVVKKYKLGKESFVVDIGSNDGTLLQSFKNRGVKVLGVDPAENIAKYANEHGIETICGYFSQFIIGDIILRKGHADIITATNVFAHVDDLDNFISCVQTLLRKGGTFIFEVPYLLDMLDNLEFDTIYHEHLSYFAIRPLSTLFNRLGMSITKIENINVHGGTIRVHIKNIDCGVNTAIDYYIANESESGLYEFKTYNEFANAVKVIRKDLRSLLYNIKKHNSNIVGYGAAAKGNILINYCDIGYDLLDYIADTTTYKQGLYTPGMHVPVKSFDEYYSNPPKYTLLLAWNYADAILEKEKKYRDNGGKFIIPIPIPRIV